MSATTARPQTHGPAAVLDRLASIRRDEAAITVEAYPHYLGHWDAWILVEITAQVRTKGGVAFEDGDVVLARPAGDDDSPGFRTCYSYRNSIDTSVPVDDVRPVLVDSGTDEHCHLVDLGTLRPVASVGPTGSHTSTMGRCAHCGYEVSVGESGGSRCHYRASGIVRS